MVWWLLQEVSRTTPTTHAVFFCICTFFSLSAADPERMASSIASLAKAGSRGVLALGCATVPGFPWGKTGGGGGGATVGAGGGGVETDGEVEVTGGGEAEEGALALFSSSEATFLNFSSSSAASDVVCNTQKGWDTMVTPET